MELSQFAQKLAKAIPELKLTPEAPLSRYTSFGIGGPAQLLAEPNSPEELMSLYDMCRQDNVPMVILGSGTNVLAPDEGLRALVIRTRGVDDIRLLEDGVTVTAGCGASMARTAAFAARNGLSGLEFAHGIPGSVGGGCIMNAGAYGGEIKDVCLGAQWLDPQGQLRQLDNSQMELDYRTSLFAREGGLVLGAAFRLEKADPQQIEGKMTELAAKRRASQPLDMPSAGSTFKRPQGGYAAALIEQAGLKGFAMGGAQVSEKHAGFVINRGGATCRDVLELIRHIQKVVYEDSGIMLEPEVKLLGR